MTSKAKSHWENQLLDVLRKEARKMGIDPRGVKKTDLIHKMRVLYWADQP